ncbi:MAG: hypothetical protein GXO30_02290, partial [Epsilonproteobacteria bacterium]|nr:hypothetical protein [Campylobacterota bacterium]
MKVFMRKIYVLLLLSVFFSFNLYSSSTVVENANDICYGVTEETGMSMGPVNIKYTGTTPITSLNNYELTDVHVALGTSSLFSAFSECGVDGVEGNCSDASGKSFMMMSVFNDGVNFDLEDLSQNETHSPYTKAMFKLFSSGDYEWIGTYVKNGVTHVGKMKPCPVSYCEEHGLSAGFNVIDPDGGDEDNSFEIFCHEDVNNIWHDLIVLPIKNTSNNFLFDSNETTLNYYDENNNSREHFQAIEIDGGHIIYDGTQPKIPVVSSRSDEPWDVTTDGNNYKVMGGKFSNINLIGTPYTIDWGNTKELLDCNESKLRKALSQAVKYNTTNLSSTSNDGKSRCQIDTMNLSLLDDYRFLVYDGEEVLQHSCKEMASYVPDNTGVLNNEDVVGHFNVLTSEPAYVDSVPTTNG